jgi:hypothetical protein
VSKATRSSLLALSLIAILAGCSKKDGGTAETKSAEAPPAATAAQPADPHPVPSVQPGTDIDLSGIAKADGGKTVAELYAEKDQLAGQKVTVRGKVVKTNAGIMDKNWLHVRDGSGAEGTNDLTVTTSGELPKVGDTVLVTGALTLNKDFGMGYQYPVIVEDAAVTIE